MLAELGAKVVSADKVAREVVQPGEEALREIITHFGQEMRSSDGSLNRKRLGQKIFTDESARKKLEAITHPKIAKSVRKQFEALRREFPSEVLIYECPLFFEASRNSDLFRNIILISTNADSRFARLKKRDSLTDEQIQSRINSQLADSEKLESVDFHISNNASLEALRSEAEKLYTKLGWN
ncbi:UNVERIFIED_CONTAM: hypothetical protein GTU68_010356 [Idotea baltica]|nr:hypothetical protein [Idotea baltica]